MAIQEYRKRIGNDYNFSWPINYKDTHEPYDLKKILADGLHPVIEARPLLAAELYGKKKFDK